MTFMPPTNPTSRSATLPQQWVGEGYFDLRLGVDELIQLQEILGVGPALIVERMLTKEWLVQDIRETIRLGLIGGGMAQKDAFDLSRRTVREGHIMDYVATASDCLFAALAGVPDEPIEDDPSGEAPAPPM